MKIKISGLYMTDIITNSSSEIFMIADHVEGVYEFLTELLGFDSREKFDVTVKQDWSRHRNTLRYGLHDLDEQSHYMIPVLQVAEQSDNYEKMFDKMVQEDKGFRDWLAEDFTWDTELGCVPSSYVITLKDGTPTELGKKLQTLFSAEEGSY